MSSALTIKVPHSIRAEAAYVLNWILVERFGFPNPVIDGHDVPEIVLSLAGAAGMVRSPCLGGWGPVTKAASAFRTKPAASPSRMTQQLGGAAPVVLFGRPDCVRNGREVALSFDFWGTIFWYLARVEELETDERDIWGCFSANQSYLKAHDLLLRPVVDEYADFLWDELHALWPGLARRAENPAVQVTCDVDVPFSNSLRGPKALGRGIAGDLVRRRSLTAVANTLRNAWCVNLRNDYSRDPNNTFAWIMDRCEEQGLRATFFFISGNHAVDPRYDLTHPFVQNLMRTIADRGHEIGMHASYVTYRNSEAIASEFANLRSSCDRLGIQQGSWGNRQHYLRWDARVTPDALDSVGFTYDTTSGFNEHVGFRCGTSHEYPLWSWQRRAPLALRERPLTVMEAAIFERSFMGLEWQDGLDLILSLKRACRRHGGRFVLLWHNSYLQSEANREAYAAVLKG